MNTSTKHDYPTRFTVTVGLQVIDTIEEAADRANLWLQQPEQREQGYPEVTVREEIRVRGRQRVAIFSGEQSDLGNASVPNRKFTDMLDTLADWLMSALNQRSVDITHGSASWTRHKEDQEATIASESP